MTTLRKKYLSKPVSGKYKEPGETIEPKSYLLPIAQKFPQKSCKITSSTPPEAKHLVLAFTNTKDPLTATNFILQRSRKTFKINLKVFKSKIN